MDPILALVAVLLIALGIGAAQVARPAPTILWFLGGCGAASSIVLAILRDTFPVFAGTGPLLASLAPTLFVAGAIGVTHRPEPRWLIPAGLTLGLSRSLLLWTGWPGLSNTLGIVTTGPIFAWGAWVLLRDAASPQSSHSRRVRTAERVLGGIFAVIGTLAMLTGAYVLETGSLPMPALLTWAGVGVPILAYGIYLSVESNRDQLRRSRDDLRARVEERTHALRETNVSLSREIDARRRTEEALRQSELRYRIVSELSSDFSFSIRLDAERGFHVEWATDAFERITGYPPDVLDGDGWQHVLSADDRDAYESDVSGATGKGITRGRLVRLLRPDGEERWLEVRAFSVPTEEPGELRVIGAARDVTEARVADRERRVLELQMEEAQRIESLGMLAGGVAHDFNNLLSVILGNARLVEDALPEGSSERGRLARVRYAAEHAATLTDQMLAYSGKAEVSLEPLSVPDFLCGVEDLLRASVGRTCRFELELPESPGPPLTVMADRSRLKRVLLNLISNASESLIDGRGTVKLSAGFEQRRREAFAHDPDSREGVPRPGPYVWIEVRDDGIGMSPEIQRRIFEPFFTTKFSGRGLGLASVLGTMRSHDGMIEIESEPDLGTCVRLLIPWSESAPAAIDRGVEPEPVEGRVLVIDDDEAVLELATIYLERAGLEVVAALGGREALEIFAKEHERLDAVVLDLTMPDMDGTRVFSRLRAIDPTIPVVLATGYAEERLEANFAGEPRCAYLHKPFLPESLTRAIEQARSDEGGQTGSDAS